MLHSSLCRFIVCLSISLIGGTVLAENKTSPPSKAVSLSFPTNDLSQYLKTERLENVYATLAGDGVCALVDFRKNRVLQMFAYGQFGTLQNLTYHVLYPESYWLEGLHVYHVAEGDDKELLYPFRYHSHTDDRASNIKVDVGRAVAELRGVALYPRGATAKQRGNKPVASCDWSVRTDGTSLRFNVHVTDDNIAAGETGVEGTLYPLYDRVVVGGEEKPIDYVPEPDVFDGPWVEGRASIELRDSKGRMPRLRITADGGVVRYQAVKLNKYLKGARSLIFRAAAPGKIAKVSVELLPNPVAISVCPLIQEGVETKLRVLTADEGTPTLELDGKAVALKPCGDNAWEGKIVPGVGRRELVARLGNAQSQRAVHAVGDFHKATMLIADALLRVQGKTDKKWPAQEGMIPQVINRDFTPRLWYGFIAVSTYMPRVVMSLAAATLATGDPKYAEAAFQACRTYVLRSKKLGEGRFIAPIFSPDGTIPERAAGWPRPSDFGIMIRGLLACHTAFVHLNRPKEAAEALDLAYQVAMGLRAVQGPGGQWSSRYNYENPRYKGGNGFVNNPHYAFWRLSELLEKVDQQKAANVRALVSDHLSSMPKLTGKEPMTSSSVGGDEDTPNDPQSWGSATAVTLTKYLLGDEERMAGRAATSAHAGIWVCDFYIDRPEGFSMPASGWKLPRFVGGHMPGRSYGGMFDLVQEEARVIVAKHLGDQFCADAAAYLFVTRLTWSLEPDGFMCGIVQPLPGHYHRNMEYAETLSYGGVGIYSLWYWRQVGRMAEGIVPACK